MLARINDDRQIDTARHASRPMIWPLLVLGFFAVCPVPSVARDPFERPCMDGSGWSCDPAYTGEFFTNARGGRQTRGATHYQGLLEAALTLDLDQTRSQIPGKLYLLAQTTHGRGITEDFIGDTQVISLSLIHISEPTRRH